ncbi:hypothetical protein F0P96_01945 [Hymenobacter busanensis]|uniref:Uncharacterized protein n=1 Tax=Hymenobacter busanensis TaxID=2607656 RepID=A0A7L4ZVH8_9BACT|nr:hypothetical protein [Hymenobacter busanensis]KAA9339405.1 hypothetical protein F0P96_01945 [Hymenobacter busanensis]QHJ06835.1 hypothetical protein GUY19_05805 [Hymenobacter busanensis]
MNAFRFWTAALFVGFTSVPALAQQTSTANTSGAAVSESLSALSRGAVGFSYDDRYTGVKGSPYVMRVWQPADITLNTNVRIPSVRLKYDALRNQLLARPDNSRPDSVMLNIASVKSFAFQDALRPGERRVFRRFEEAPVLADKQAFVEVLHEGQYTLLKRYGKEFRKANFKGAYSENRPYDEVLDRTQYFLRRPDGHVNEVKLSVKSFAGGAPELAAKLKSVADRAERNLKTESEFAALLAAAEKQ